MVADKLNQQKRQHRERSQPAHRKKLGLLEKHADYVKRARDFHSKEDRIQKLREKAAGRNKDEFYFGMINSRTKKGVHMQSRGNEALGVDLVKVLKTQDAAYIRTVLSSERNRVARLEQKLNALLDAPSAPLAEGGDSGDEWDESGFDEPMLPEASTSGRKHTVFTDNLDAVRTATDVASVLPKRAPAPRPSTSEAKKSRKGKGKAVASLVDPAQLAAEESERAKAATAYRAELETELSARRDRLVQLQRAAREIEMQRLLMGKGAKESLVAKKVEKKKDEMNWEEQDARGAIPEAESGIATGARVWKWKQERKR